MTMVPTTQADAIAPGGPVPGGSRDGGPHIVQFYDDDATLARAVVDFLAPGLAARQSAVIVATPAHTAAFEARLVAKGFDVAGARGSGRLMVLDAEETMQRLIVDGWPDWGRFATQVPPLLEQAAARARDGQVRVYGEMVDVLWQQGKQTAALRLEEMWTELQQTMPFTLLCAYSFSHFYVETGVLDMVCGPHSHVLPPAGGRQVTAPVEHLRSLVAEIAHRKDVERALRTSVNELHEKEVTLRRTEDELRDFVENGAVALHWLDRDGVVSWANRAELEFLGYPQGEYVGKSIRDFYIDPDRAEELLGRLAKHEDVHGFEARLRARDGSIKHALITASAFWRDGLFVHTRCFTRDITAFKTAESAREARVRRAETLKTITAAVADAVTAEQVFQAVVDQSGAALEASTGGLWLLRAESASLQLCRASGYREAQRRAVETIPIGPGAPSLPVVAAAQSGELVWIDSPDQLVARYPQAAHLVTPGRHFSTACLPVAVQGRTLGVLAFTFDDARPFNDGIRTFLLLVSRYTGQALERLRLFEAEQRSRLRAELLYGLAAAVIGAARVEDVFDAALDAVERALGADGSAILLRDSDAVTRVRAWRALSADDRQALESEEPWSSESGAPRARAVENVSAGIRSVTYIPLLSSGTLVGRIAVCHATSRTLLSQELDLAGAIANHVAAAVSRFTSLGALQKTVRLNEVFAGILGHDLRNPLSAILTSARVALRRDQTEALRKPLARILNSGDRMTRMIDQLLDFTRVRLGAGLALARARVDLGQLLRQVVDELEGAHPEARVSLECRGDASGEWDADRLAQVFSNLVGNAVEHGEAGAEVSVVVDGRSATVVSAAIGNRGSLPSELLSRLFEPLVGGEGPELGHGLGLGLYISHELVRGHGGSIAVASSAETGTLVTVELPRAGAPGGHGRTPRREMHGPDLFSMPTTP